MSRLVVPLSFPISPSIREEKIGQYLDFVNRAARRIHKRYPFTDFDDLVQTGALALVEAAGEDTGQNFRAYARHRIYFAMLDSFKGEPYRYRSTRLELVDAAAPAKPLSDLRLEIESLPGLEGQVLLRRLDGFSQKEIAGHIQMSRGEVRAIEERAISKLKARQKAAIRRAA